MIGVTINLTAMTAKHPLGKGTKCHHCGKFRHTCICQNCRKFTAQANKSDSSESEKPKSVKYKAHMAEVRESDSNSSDSESIRLVARHALSTSAG